MTRIALLSPNKEAYSETFIKAQKDNLYGTVLYYFGGFLPSHLEGVGKLKRSYNYYWKLLIAKIFKMGSFSLSHMEWRLLKSLRKNKVQVVLAQYGQTGANCLRVCKKLKIPMIVHFHGYDSAHEDVISQYGETYKEMFAYAKYIVVVSKAMKAKLIYLGAQEEKLILNHYGPGNSFLYTEPDYSSDYFIAVGRFANTKAPYYILFAFNQVLKKCPSARLIMVGDGPLLGDCINIARFLGIDKKVTFSGSISHEEVVQKMKQCFCFVQHSVTTLSGDMEGTPNTILEASAIGLPVVSTYHAGIPDVIIHNETGHLVEEHDVASMAENMIRLFENREEAKKMGLAGKKNIGGNFTLKKYISQLDNIIQKAIN